MGRKFPSARVEVLHRPHHGDKPALAKIRHRHTAAAIGRPAGCILMNQPLHLIPQGHHRLMISTPGLFRQLLIAHSLVSPFSSVVPTFELFRHFITE